MANAMEPFDGIASHDLDRLAAALAQGADPNGTSDAEPPWTPLHAAIEELEHGGSTEALVLLLRAGARADSWDARRDATPLLMSLFRRQPEATRLLLAAGADPNMTGAEGDTPLRWCVDAGDHATAATLLRCGATATIDTAGGPRGMTALGRAVSRLDRQMVALLLRAGADPAAQDADRRMAREYLPGVGALSRDDTGQERGSRFDGEQAQILELLTAPRG
jgi:ankyrin repeat protein